MLVHAISILAGNGGYDNLRVDDVKLKVYPTYPILPLSWNIDGLFTSFSHSNLAKPGTGDLYVAITNLEKLRFEIL